MVLGLIGLGLGRGLQNLVGQPRIATAATLVLMLIPWFLHHQLLVENDIDAGRTAYFGPGIMSLTATAALFLGGRARLLVASIPAIAFIVTWKITIPLVLQMHPMNDLIVNNLILSDNMRTIWLAVWTIFATMFLLA